MPIRRKVSAQARDARRAHVCSRARARRDQNATTAGRAAPSPPSRESRPSRDHWWPQFIPRASRPNTSGRLVEQDASTLCGISAAFWYPLEVASVRGQEGRPFSGTPRRRLSAAATGRVGLCPKCAPPSLENEISMKNEHGLLRHSICLRPASVISLARRTATIPLCRRLLLLWPRARMAAIEGCRTVREELDPPWDEIMEGR